MFIVLIGSLVHDYIYSQLIMITLQMAPDYDHLTLMQKVEVFEHALNNTNGDDLAKILWFKSPSSEVCVTPNCLIILLYIVIHTLLSVTINCVLYFAA